MTLENLFSRPDPCTLFFRDSCKGKAGTEVIQGFLIAER